MTYVEQLLQERERVLLEEVRAERSRPLAGDTDLAQADVGDETDASVAIGSGDLRVLEAVRDVQELLAISGALNRLADGTYGTCSKCGGPIEPRRLEAQPTATRCFECQWEREHVY
jgi:RNA polymerase-binding transcription factor DksA